MSTYRCVTARQHNAAGGSYNAAAGLQLGQLCNRPTAGDSCVTVRPGTMLIITVATGFCKLLRILRRFQFGF